ncbi:MAG: GMC family oxidoreductase N-terminal domain-containing protein, partial [Bacteroidales bacterium]|nr:GMC family oxidoreductase N-terminal domain-containing protein [Bacteroidales bacterium]
MPHDYDYVIIGSGFGGAVSALRLAEKGYSVLVLEKGKWFKNKDFPKTNWRLRKWLWMPGLGFRGIMKITFLKHASILSGTGVGGGSLVYANTLPIPKDQFFKTGSWKNLKNWKSELEPFYQEGWRMLGACENPKLETGDLAIKELAKELKRPDQFEATKVAVNFSEPGETSPDPYFDGKGPDVTGCTFCGACMTGCRHGAKNTLDRNYLWLAQKQGVEILAENLVRNVLPDGPDDGSEGYSIVTKDSSGIRNKKREFKAKNVIFAGGVLGSVRLMLKLKQKSLPMLSDRLGYDIRTKKEWLIGVVSLDKEKVFSKGVAIGSILHTDE